MPSYRKRFITEPQSSAPLDPLRGRQLMKRDRASAVHATGDRVLSHGRRILACVGLHGGERWHMPDTAVSSFSHPDSATARPCVRTPAFALTPGHFIKAVVVANPSGLTSTIDGNGTYISGGVAGQVQIAVTYDNGVVETVEETITIPGSSLKHGAQPAGKGAAWSSIYRRRTGFLLPANLSIPANLAAWSHGVTASIKISYIGSPRAIDVTVYEEPLALGYDLATDDWIAPMHANGVGGNLGQLVGPRPQTRTAVSDPGGGAEIVTDAARRLGQEIGPALLFASSWDEGNQPVTSTEASYKSVTGTSYRELLTATLAAYSTSLMGWSSSSGANARRVQESEATAVLRDDDNVVPVRCYVYGSLDTTSGLPTATVRFETATYSIAEIAVPTGVIDAWHSAPGHLRCGLGAQDPTVLQVRAKTTVSTAGFRWRYIAVVFDDV